MLWPKKKNLAMTLPVTVPIIVAAAYASILSSTAAGGPTVSDTWSSFGAVLAAAITVLEGRQRNRALWQLIPVFIGSIAVGMIVPGAVIHTYFIDKRFTWHIWSGLGFLAGLGGWAITHAIVIFFSKRAHAIIAKVADRTLGPIDSESSDKLEHPENYDVK